MFELYFPVLIRISLQSPGLGEGGEAAVVSFLDVGGETAAGKLPA